MSATDIVLIIGAIALAAVNIITALKVQAIAHSVNSAASMAVAEIKSLNAQKASLAAQLSEEKQIAERLAQKAGPTQRKSK